MMSDRPTVDAAHRALASGKGDGLAHTYLVEAGAGTGKTTVLVDRLLALILSGVAISRIVAITFTEKAAGELKIRLRAELEAAARAAEKDESRAGEAAILTGALHQIDRAQVSTIHGFCSTLLKERPVEAGVDPNFGVTDEFRRTVILDTVWDTWLREQFSESLPACVADAEALGHGLDRIRELALELVDQRDLLDMVPGPVDVEDVGALAADLVAEAREFAELARTDCTDSDDGAVGDIEGFVKQAEMIEHVPDEGRAAYALRQVNPRPVGHGKQGNWSDGVLADIKARAKELRARQAAHLSLLSHNASVGLVQWLRGFLEAYEREKSRMGLLDFEDLLVKARDLVRDNLEVREDFKRAFDHVLLDEFQDTDRTQWDIVSTVFGEGHGTLVIIGDPKQAIYAFRGADVSAYLAAVDDAADQATLGTNWRSDGPLITALEAVLDGVGFGDDRITFQKVGPAPGHEKSSITGVPAPLQIRLVSEEIDRSTKWLYVDDARDIVAGDTAEAVADLLRGEVSIPDDSAPGGRRQIEPSDIAVLCRKNAEIDLVERELIKRSVPVVKGRTGSVLLTEAADHWLALLHAIERPSSPNLVRRALATPFFGWTAERIVGADDETLAAEHDRIAGWADLLRHKGVPTLVERVDRSTSMTSRVLGCSGGERLLTDLLHVAEILHTTTRNGGVRSLAEWLGNEIALAAGRPEEAETRLRRLETDDQAVQLLTIHTAKGLEFPIVLVPFLWVPRPSPKIAVPVFHDPDTGRRMIDVGGEESPGYETHSAMHDAEQASEDFRLLYVATTRARHHLAVWWAPYSGAKKATLTKVLFGREQPGDRIDDTTPGVLLPHGEMRARLAPILDRADEIVAQNRVRHPLFVAGGETLSVLAREGGQEAGTAAGRTGSLIS